ncbi:MAG: outer membrane protein assembly factor BamE [Stappiaceae bacterium]
MKTAIDFTGRKRKLRTLTLSVVLVASLSGCFTKTLQRGHVIPEDTLEEIQVGSSAEQVELLLGTPSTTSTINGQTYYYISQKSEQIAFMKEDIVDQRVVAVYFDEEGRVRDLGNYGIKDGKVFDFIDRTTRTGGQDYGFLTQVLRGAASPTLGL